MATSSTSNPTPPAPQQAGFVAGELAIRLLLAVGGAVILCAGVTAGVIALSHHSHWWPAWVAALTVATMAGAASLGPVLIGLHGGTQYAAYGYLAGAVLRILAALTGVIAAVLLFRLPALPTLMLTIPLYFAQVLVEALVLGRAFWPGRKDRERSLT